MNRIFVGIFVAFLLSIAIRSYAETPRLIHCEGEDAYADTKWTHDLMVYSDYTVVNYVEIHSNSNSLEKVKNVDGRVELPVPDGAIRTFLLLNSEPLEIEVFGRHSGERQGGSYDYFICE